MKEQADLVKLAEANYRCCAEHRPGAKLAQLAEVNPVLAAQLAAVDAHEVVEC